ncbi:MAG: 50S ribosomal protein L12 [Candidatus Pacearchaeota archaeon]|nr:50S ribosomal protein L12 [Candidatus Pacearchaeota archaeon]
MEYVYGALLLHKTGQAVSEVNLTKVIQATGSSVDEAKVKVLVASLKDVDIAKELESATLMASQPQATAAAEKKEEKKEEKASEAAEGLSALFG